jgi:hypothetical protein
VLEIARLGSLPRHAARISHHTVSARASVTESRHRELARDGVRRRCRSRAVVQLPVLISATIAL